MLRPRLILAVALLFAALTAQTAVAQTVVVDTGHGERFSISETGPLQLSGFAEILRGTGCKIATVKKPISDATLAEADGLVISGAFIPLDRDEVEAVMRFMQRGGKVAVMLHIAPPLTSLLDRLKISHTNGVIQERENVIGELPINFKVNRLGNHAVLKGLHDFSLYGVWGLMNRDSSSRIIAATGPKAWVDLRGDKVQTKDETASFGVAVAGEVGKGGFIVFGDDAIFQNKFLDRSNKALAANLAKWLK